jgi:hypothetical protein
MFKKSKLFLCMMALAVSLTGVAVPASALTTDAAKNNTTMSNHVKKCHMGHSHAMELLAEITGKSVADLRSQYPQKTAWQAAKSMGKLDDLKKAYLARTKVYIDNLVAEKKITADDGAKMYADVQKRIAAIDGVNIVIPGKPNFEPQMPSR